jgi:hypothetical protein
MARAMSTAHVVAWMSLAVEEIAATDAVDKRSNDIAFTAGDYSKNCRDCYTPTFEGVDGTANF